MDQKRGDVAISSLKAQITIFMILGLVILFVFLFLIQLSIRINQDQLELSKENVLTQAFKKEGLRLYVDDCLRDELEQGVLLLGRQGRLWADQPGGRLNFEPGKTGIIYAPGEQLGKFDSSRVAYGLTRKTYLEHENAYPCIEEANAPAFCQYRFPNTSLGFGSLEVLPSTLKGDLQRFMANRTVWCVQEFLLNNVSRQVVLESKPAEVSVDVFDDGISVKSEYPLRFKVGQNEFFHLSTFDFFYSSQFGKFLNDIITFPLQQDQHYLDFDYSPESLNEPFFTFSSEVNLGRTCLPQDNIFSCKRSLRPGTMGSLAVEVTAAAAENGDDIFTFRPALYKIVNSPAPFVFRVARQNRPPALDYINRSQCPAGGYDYLVIKGHETLGGINISAFALDPDEDAIKYEFENKVDGRRIEMGNNYNFSIMKEDMNAITPSPEPYVVVVNVTDSHKQSDWQQVRILVDRPMQTSVTLQSPYEDVSYSYGDNYYHISREDPVYLWFSMPEASKNFASSGEQVAFNYDDDGPIPVDVGELVQGMERPSGEVCYNLPIARMEQGPDREPKRCGTLDGYKEEDVVGGFPPGLNFFERDGTLMLKYSVNYCGTNTQEESTSLNVRVEECVPHKNSAHPFPYPYHEYTFGTKEEGGKMVTDRERFVGEQNINPFEAEHACCANWEIRKSDDPVPCFVNPEPGCYGQLNDRNGNRLTTKPENKGYIWEKQRQLCKGDSGLRCEGNYDNKLYQDQLWCGGKGERGCTNVEERCQNKPSFSPIKDIGWCNGQLGCEKLCKDGIVYTNDENPPLTLSINSLATRLILSGTVPEEGTEDFPYRCGCEDIANPTKYDGEKCDNDYNGRFEGVCDNGICNEIVCSVRATQCDPDNPARIQQCNELRTGWELDQTCPEETPICEEQDAGPTCVAQKCVPNSAPICFGHEDIQEIYMEEIGRMTQQQKNEAKRMVFICNERGLDYNNIDGCGSDCNPNTVLVQEGDSWRCGTCREGEVNKPCRKVDDHRTGTCTQNGDTFSCDIG